MKRKFSMIFMFALAVLFLASCSHGVDVTGCIDGVHIYGFWGGLWHGMIAPFDFIAGFFNSDIVVFAQNNSGRWYDFGFVLGIGGFATGARQTKR